MQNVVFTQLSIPEVRNLLREELESFFIQKEAEKETKQPEPQPEYITKTEAAKLLKCSTATIDNYRRNGKLKRYNHLGQIVWFKRSEVLGVSSGYALKVVTSKKS